MANKQNKMAKKTWVMSQVNSDIVAMSNDIDDIISHCRNKIKYFSGNLTGKYLKLYRKKKGIIYKRVPQVKIN